MKKRQANNQIGRSAPELVAPAGNLEKLKTALEFGADAVYLGGQEFSLRAQADNFEISEIREAVKMAHDLGRRVYVTVNIFAHNADLKRLPDYLQELGGLNIDGLIISDPGVFLEAQSNCPQVPITISTQANVTNFRSAEFYYQAGARRVVLARELSLTEIALIKEQVPIEVEVFVHGAMCLSYSGRCWLSQAMTGRDANRGLCAHPCRYRYYLQEEYRPGQLFPVFEDGRGTYVMNSSDLCLLEYIPQLIAAGVDAFKIEGRMKSPHYVATTVKVYREAIDAITSGGRVDFEEWKQELARVATRPFTTGFVTGRPTQGQDIEKTEPSRRTLFCGMVRGYDRKRHLVAIEQRAPFKTGEVLEFLEPGQKIRQMVVKQLFNSEMEEIEVARHPQERIWLPSDYEFKTGTIVARLPGEKSAPSSVGFQGEDDGVS